MHRSRELALIVGLLALSAGPRLPGIGRFTSIDEPFWLRQSANFYYALGQRDFQLTLYEYHPAVTTMWIITAGMLAYFPEYRALGQGYLKPGKVDLFLLDHGKEPLQLLIASRLIQVLVVLLLLLAIYSVLRQILGPWRAFFVSSMISLSPFLVGQSRLLNHEAMVGLFSTLALVALFAFLHRRRTFVLLLLSGVAAGLAQLTKSSAMPILPLAFVAIAVEAFRSPHVPPARRLFSAAKILGLWLVIAAATYVAVWPGMWVSPATMLQDVYGNAVSYAIQGARMSVLPAAGSSVIEPASVVGGIGIYLNDLWWRTTPLTALGLLAGVAFAFISLRGRSDGHLGMLVVYALALAAAFVLLFGIQRGPKPPHYLVTSYVALDLVAGLGLLYAWDVLRRRWRHLGSEWIAVAAASLILALQMASGIAFYPYYISYYNPIVEALQPGIQNPTLNENGYGMGLDQAAAYLAAKPQAANLTVLSAHGLGSFSYYFPGTTVPMNDLDMSDPVIERIVKESDYVVVDFFNQSRKNSTQDMQDVEPERRIWLNHLEFLHIYRAADLLKQP